MDKNHNLVNIGHATRLPFLTLRPQQPQNSFKRFFEATARLIKAIQTTDSNLTTTQRTKHDQPQIHF